MLSRRDFAQVFAATATLLGHAALRRAAAQQSITQADLLRFRSIGQVTLLHIADLHAQLVPGWYREPAIHIGVGPARTRPPHLTGRAALDHFKILPGLPMAHALSSEDFVALARSYGRMGGLDRIATLVTAIRSERPTNTLLLDGGDAWQGSYTALKSRGADMVEAMNALGVEAMTAHGEFTLGRDRVLELKDELQFPLLASNVRDTEWNADAFEPTAYFEPGGVKLAVIGQAYPFMLDRHPRQLTPNWTFGLREDLLRKRIVEARSQGAEVVVLLSHNGFDVDRKLAGLIQDIDVIFSAHSHDALPEPVRIGRSLIVASGGHGKFLSRLDLEVKGGRIAEYRYRLIPVFAEAITPEPEMAQLVERLRAPHAAELGRVLGRTEGLLYRRGTLGTTMADLIAAAMLSERDAEIALAPGHRWGGALLPGHNITIEDVYNHTATTYPEVARREMSGARIMEILEDAADAVFNPDAFQRHGEDMLRSGGLAYKIDPERSKGRRITELVATRTGRPIEAERGYVVAAWGTAENGVEGPPIYDLLARYIAGKKSIDIAEPSAVSLGG